MGKHTANEAAVPRTKLTRRRFLQISGTGVGIYLVESRIGRSRPTIEYEPISATVSHLATVHRREDMLDLGFLFYNLQVSSTGNGPALTRIDPNAPALISVCFAPQWVAEAAWLDDACGAMPTVSPMPALIANSTSTTQFGPGSRLVFEVPNSIDKIPYTIEALLNWPEWAPALPATASAPGTALNPAPPIVAPVDTETAIEAPWRMVLAPEPAATWGHALEPVTHNDRSELWHTRLSMRRSSTDPRADESTHAPIPTVRAVWSPDYGDGSVTTQFPPLSGSPKLRETMAAGDRSDIVALTAQYGSTIPIPVTAKLLHLSPLGASVDLEGSWPFQSLPATGGVPNNLVFWKHRGTQGRDNYVRVVREGCLMPFRHHAVYIEESIRRVDQTADGPVANVHQRLFIIVIEAKKSYGASGVVPNGQPNDGRDFPYASVEIKTLVTPPLLPPDNSAFFIPQFNNSCNGGSGGEDFLWTMVATDEAGQQTHLRMPLAFVFGTGTGLDVFFYNDDNAVAPARKSADLNGQLVCFAPPTKPGATTFATHTVKFGAAVPDGTVDHGEANFFPVVMQADVKLDAAAAVSGNSLTPTTIKFDTDYLTNGYANTQVNQTGVFARIVGGLGLGFGNSAASGGVASPSVNLAGLSRDLGAVGGDHTKSDPFADLKDKTFTPASFFTGDQVPMIFGNVPLTAILADVSSVSTPGSPDFPDVRIPQLTNELIHGNGADQPPTAVKTSYHWEPALKQGPQPTPIFDNHYTNRSVTPPQTTDATFVLDVILLTPVGDPSKRTSTITGDLKNFTIGLPSVDSSFLLLGFHRLCFSATNGGKPTVDVKLGTVTFGGPLAFVNTLEEFLKFPGSGLSIDLEPTSVAANTTIALPTVAIGVFSLQNLSFTAGLLIPFDGNPVLAHFAFCSRENPFLVSVAIFGGGGFFSLYVDPNAVEVLEISVEFGGNVAFDIVVASGGVHVMAGIYFKLDGTGSSAAVTLTGFVKIGGSLSVLGLVTMSLEFDMSLSYLDRDHQSLVVGEATLTVSIDLAFFSIPVSMSVRKEFGGGGDPTFAQMLTQSDWTHYCDAFAA